MDRERFDALTRLFSSSQTRRTAVFGLLGAPIAGALLGHDADVEAKNKGKGKARKQKVKAQAVPAKCFIQGCTLTKSNLSKCDFGGTSTLSGKNLTGYNLSNINLEDADASGANFTGVNFAKSCLVDADLSGATINGTTNFSQTIRCRTTMPNGTVDNTGCNKGTTCCPTCIEEGETCGAGIGGSCCDGTSCVNGVCVCGPCTEVECQTATCEVVGGVAVCNYDVVPDGDQGPLCDGADEICCSGSCVTGVCCTDDQCPGNRNPDCVGNQCICAAEGGPCPAGQRCCNNAPAGCANLQTDNDHCGNCATACGTCEVCSGGQCVNSTNGISGPGCANKCCNGVCCAATRICGGTPQQCCLPTGAATGNPAQCCSEATSGGLCT
jgi:hypothetical protein